MCGNSSCSCCPREGWHGGKWNRKSWGHRSNPEQEGTELLKKKSPAEPQGSCGVGEGKTSGSPCIDLWDGRIVLKKILGNVFKNEFV